MGITIRGLDELDNLFKTPAPELLDGPLRKAVTGGGKILQAAIAENAPELESPESPGSDALPPGALRSDITMHAFVVKGGTSATAIIEPGKYTKQVARFVEYGHRMVRGGYARVISSGPNKGRSRGPGKALEENVPAHPFIRPAVEANMARAQAEMNAIYGREFAKVARRKLRK